MISTPFVKTRILELLQARSTFESVSLLYGKPESPSDLSGSDPLVQQSVMFDDPEGELIVDEMCGPLRMDYREEYAIDLIVQVMARTRDATAEFVDDRRAWLMWEIVQALQDSTLGFATTDDSRFDQVYVELGEVVNVSGWMPAASTNLAASRSQITLNVQANITIEA